MQHIGHLCVRQFNCRYGRSGTLFEGRFKSCLVQSSQYLLNCLCYSELNPVRAGIVKDPGDYRWSSYRSHAFGTVVQMQTQHPRYLALGRNLSPRQAAYRQLINQQLSAEVIGKIRQCTNTGLVLGSEAFRQQVAQLRS